jgi:hypothetical protein
MYLPTIFFNNGGVYLYAKTSLVKHQPQKMVHIFEP